MQNLRLYRSIVASSALILKYLIVKPQMNTKTEQEEGRKKI